MWDIIICDLFFGLMWRKPYQTGKEVQELQLFDMWTHMTYSFIILHLDKQVKHLAFISKYLHLKAQSAVEASTIKKTSDSWTQKQRRPGPPRFKDADKSETVTLHIRGVKTEKKAEGLMIWRRVKTMNFWCERRSSRRPIRTMIHGKNRKGSKTHAERWQQSSDGVSRHV